MGKLLFGFLASQTDNPRTAPTAKIFSTDIAAVPAPANSALFTPLLFAKLYETYVCILLQIHRCCQ